MESEGLVVAWTPWGGCLHIPHISPPHPHRWAVVVGRKLQQPPGGGLVTHVVSYNSPDHTEIVFREACMYF